MKRFAENKIFPVIFYLCACFFSIFANTLGQYFCQGTSVSVMNLFLHVDLINLFICSILIFTISIKDKQLYLEKGTFLLHKRQLIFFSFPVFSSLFKTFLLGFIPATNMAISSFLTPFVVAILALFLLKEKLPKEYLIFASLACVGFYISNSNKIEFSLNSNVKWILSYVALNSVSVVVVRFFAMKRRFLEAVFIENLIYAVYGALLFLTTQKFSLDVLFSYKTLLCSLLAFSHHFFIILAYKNAQQIANIQLLDFSKVIFAMIISYFLFQKIPSNYTILGSMIIFIAVYKANIKLPKRKIAA
jgi:drug/metabolite transporter (DMT)-like permease